MKKITVFILTAALSLSFLHAEKIVLPINAEETGHTQPAQLSFEWNEKWFGSLSPFEYNHNIARVACALAETAYVNDKADPDRNQIKNVYRKLGAQDSSFEFHYDLDYTAPGLGFNQAGFSFASKEINSSKGRRTLVFITVRGTPFSAPEWISNVNVSDSSRRSEALHEGFFLATSQIHNALIYYLLKNKIDPDTCYFLITGHSRGAAISNLLGATLADEGYFDSNNIFVYTFAAPNVSQETERCRDPKYNFIWNIVNPEDIVPTVPMQRGENWKFTKFGQTKTIVNMWNTEQKKMEEDLYPRVNAIFNQIMHRDYYPFNTGSYIPALTTRLLTSLYPHVKNYYSSPIALRKPAEKIFYEIYPEEAGDVSQQTDGLTTSAPASQNADRLTINAPASQNADGLTTSADSLTTTTPAAEPHQKRTVMDIMGDKINAKTGGFLSYSSFAFLDMHICSNYLSWMLALEEDELFSDEPSSRLLINGSMACAIFDENGQIVTRVIDGLPVIESIKTPVLTVPTPQGVWIGFPSSRLYTVVVYKDSLLPTPVPVTIEHYNAQGYLTEICPKERLWPHEGMAYVFTVGPNTLEEKQVIATKIRGKETKAFVKEGKLKQQDIFRVQPEIAIDTDGYFEAGVRIGSRMIHGDAILGQSLTDLGKSISASAGIGHETTLIDRMTLDTSLYGKYIWALRDIEEGNHIFNFVPEARFTLGFKPFRRRYIYISGVFDFHIQDFNDQAFTDTVRNNNMGHIKFSDTVEAIPSIRFGLRF